MGGGIGALAGRRGAAIGFSGATTVTAGAGAGAAGFKAAMAAGSSGLPGFVARALRLASNGTGGGGGFTWATTGRVCTLSGGLGLAAAAPMTLVCTGATGANDRVGALATISRVTITVSLATGLDCAKAAASTATTAPWTPWLT